MNTPKVHLLSTEQFPIRLRVLEDDEETFYDGSPGSLNTFNLSIPPTIKNTKLISKQPILTMPLTYKHKTINNRSLPMIYVK